MNLFCPDCGATMAHDHARHAAPCGECDRPMALKRPPANHVPPRPAPPGPTYWALSALAGVMLVGLCLGILLPKLMAIAWFWLRGSASPDPRTLPLVAPWHILVTLAVLALVGSLLAARRRLGS